MRNIDFLKENLIAHRGLYEDGIPENSISSFERAIKFGYIVELDIHLLKDNNIVVFPNGNWLTNKVYYNSQKGEYMSLKDEVISDDYISENSKYTEKLLDVSNNIIVFDLLNKDKNESKVAKEASK